ncbi:MAG TPA: hypothetical protein VHD83_06985 [Puia sp.]|nr:hypothetical protein [Puia sp.]
MKRCLIFFLLLTAKAGSSQGPVHLHVRMLAKAYEDSIVVRWSPENAVGWQLGRDSGYIITRIDYTDAQHPVSSVLSASPFKPMTLDEMKAHLDRNDKYAAIAAQAMYGKEFRMTRQEPKGFAKQAKQSHDVMNFRYAFSMQAADFSAPVATALALRWVDKDVKKGSKYVYLITMRAGNKSYVLDSAATFLTNVKGTQPQVPEGLEAYGFDRRVELHWHRRQMGNFSAYFIQRSDDGGKTFKALNELPYFSPDQVPGDKKDTLHRKIASLLRDHQVYIDSIPQDYRMYYYRVQGINAFAERSDWSAAVKVQGRDLTGPMPPVIDSANNLAGSRIRIHWTQRLVQPDLAGYYVSRANSVKGPFYPLTKSLLDKGARSFIDTAALPHQPNYYVVMAVDTAKNVSTSAAFAGYLTDTVAPAAPTGVAGTIDSNGLVHLHWAVNKEADIKGYKVYYGYNPGYEFSQLTIVPVTDNQYTDSISMQNLDRVIYYKVVAVDKSNNHSAYSVPVGLKKPLVVPPTAPVAGAVSTAGRGVTIEWIESRSRGAAGYEVFRKGPDTLWHSVGVLHQDWNKRSLLFTDTAVRTNTDYYYAAETIDSTGSRSVRSFAVHVRHHAVDSLAVPVHLRAVADRKQHVTLSWEYQDSGDFFFVVYRGVNNGAMDPWHSFGKDARSGEDVQVPSGVYAYAIKVVHRDKAAASGVSQPIIVKVDN